MNIPSDVGAPLIAAIAALAVAGVGLWSALNSARNQRQTQLAVEKLKAEIVIELDRRQKKAARIKEQADFLVKDIESIQRNRDNLLLIAESPYNVVRTQELLGDFKSSISELSELYQKQAGIDNTDYIKELHKAKGLLISVQAYVLKYDDDGGYGLKLTDKDRDALRYTRGQLGAIQEQLKTEYLKLITNFLEL